MIYAEFMTHELPDWLD